MYALYVYVLCVWYNMNVHVICLHMCIVYSPMQVLVETKVDIKMSSSIASLWYSLRQHPVLSLELIVWAGLVA